MNKLIWGALLAIGSLSYFAVNPTPPARIPYIHPNERVPPEEWLTAAEADADADANDPFYMTSLGFGHAAINLLPDGVERDSLYGASLVEQAMEAGYSRAGTFWYNFIDKSQDGMERAARAGSYSAILGVATQHALSFCETGELPEGEMESFLRPYRGAMDPAHQASFVPEHYRPRFEAGITYGHSTILTGVLERIPAGFVDMCADPESMRAMLPKT